MKKLFLLPLVIFCIMLVNGCAALSNIAEDIQDTDASVEIAAVSTLTDDIVKNPWDNIIQIGLGYTLALLRRWYKKKQGAK